MTTSYRTVFGLPPKEAASMARLTKGYPFAFQILGYLKWENDGTIDDILPKFDEELTVYAYEKYGVSYQNWTAKSFILFLRE